MLGEESRARNSFDGLVRFARAGLESAPAGDYFAKFGEKESAKRREAHLHYLLALGLRGLGREAEARAEFQHALNLYPHFSRAARQLR
jgi:hypothetical protein